MRTLILVLLFTLLPLQSHAAAAEACCGQIQVAEGLQNKHHQPAHGLAITMVVLGEDGAVSSNIFDLHCGICHPNCVAVVFTIEATFIDTAGSERIEHLEPTRVPPWHARPYRPQWRSPIRSGPSTAA